MTADHDHGFLTAPVGLIVTRNRKISACNDRFAEMFGYAPADLVGQMTAILYPSHHDFVEIGRLGRSRMQETGRHEDERIMKRRDESLFWCRALGQSADAAHPFRQCTWCFIELSEARKATQLTPRERQVAMHLLRGQDSKTIARVLGISPRTVEIYRSNLLRKYGVRSTPELVSLISQGPF